MNKPFDYEGFRQKAVQQLKTGEHNLTSIQGLLAPVLQDILQAALWPEDSTKKEINTSVQAATVPETPTATSRPSKANAQSGSAPWRSTGLEQTLKKRMERDILELYQHGASYEIIREKIALTYRQHLDNEAMMKITDQLLPQLAAWQNRPLQTIYTCLWVTDKVVNSWQDGTLVPVTAYSVIAIDLQGNRDVLGHYIDTRSVVEFWQTLLQDLKNRGVADFLMVCVGNPGLLRDVVKQVYPHTQAHICIMYQMRTTLQHVTGANLLKLRKDLKSVYQAADLPEADARWQTVKITWGQHFPIILESWERNWNELVALMRYPELVRKVAYGNKLIEFCNEQLDKLAKTNGYYLIESELLKLLYAHSRHILFKYKSVINNWGLISQQVGILLEERTKNIGRSQIE